MSKLGSCVLALAAGFVALAPAASFAAGDAPAPAAKTVAAAPAPKAPPVPKGAKDCRGFRAVGSGLTNSIATLMATQGAINLAENRGFTVIGDAKLQSCASTGIFGVECAATSYACKMPH